MRQQVVELDDQRQEVVSRQRRLLLQRLQIILEGVRAALDGRQAQGRSLALHGVHLPEQSVQFLAEHAFLARRLAQHRVDHFHSRVGVVQERRQLHRIYVQNAQQGIHLTLRLGLRGLKFIRQLHPGGHVRYGHQHMGHLAVDAHPVKIELQIARIEFAVAAVDVHFDFAERIDGLDEFLVGALGPEDFDELERRRQSPFRHDVLEQLLEGEAGEVLALEQRFQCARISRTDDQIRDRAGTTRLSPCAEYPRSAGAPAAGCCPAAAARPARR